MGATAGGRGREAEGPAARTVAGLLAGLGD